MSASATKDEGLRRMVAQWQTENGYSDESAVAHLLLALYRHVRIYAFVQETGIDWHGSDLERLGKTIATTQYILSGGQHDASFEDSLTEFVSWHVLELHRMSYREYLRTPEWQDVRYFARRRANERCQICNSSERIEVHHRTYARRGSESLADVTVLCRSCHGAFHARGEIVH